MFQTGLSKEQRVRLIALTRLAVKNFNGGDWQALGAYTGCSDIVTNHDRLLRSLSFGDDDYSGNAHGVIFSIAERDPANVGIIEQFITEHYGEPDPVTIGENVSTAHSKGRKIIFSPSVFDVPDGEVENDLIAVDVTPSFPPAGVRAGRLFCA